MDTADMQERLHLYLGDLGGKAPVTKEDILNALAGNDDALRTMIAEYIPEGTYPDLRHAITLIPEEAWRAAQGDVWRGGDIGEDAESGFDASPVAKAETGSANGDGRSTAPTRDTGMPGGGAGRKEDTQSRDAGVWPASGPHPDNPDATYRSMASFGQRERGAAGYEDSGNSEVRTIPPRDGNEAGSR